MMRIILEQKQMILEQKQIISDLEKKINWFDILGQIIENKNIIMIKIKFQTTNWSEKLSAFLNKKYYTAFSVIFFTFLPSFTKS